MQTATGKQVTSTSVSDDNEVPLVPAPEPVATELTADVVEQAIAWTNALKPRRYQLEGIAYLRNKKRAWICDAPGLGKMLQCAYAASTPALVIAPAYLCGVWHDWLVKYGKPSWKIIDASQGSRRERQALLNKPAHFHIINIEMMQRRRAPGQKEDGSVYNPDSQKYEPSKMLEFKYPPYRTLIIDEAHHLRGYTSSQSMRVFKLSQMPSVEYVFLATATPSYNNVLDMFAQYRLLDSKRFTSYWKFAQTYCATLQTPWGPKVVGVKSYMVPSLRKLFTEYAIRRTYSDVSLQLPALQETDIRIDLAPAVRKRYDTLRQTFRDSLTDTVKDNLPAVLHALRKLTAGSKLPYVLELLTDSNALTGTIIFCEYKATVYALAELLKCPAITGDISADERRRLIKESQLVVATIPSISEGIDASHLHTVVFFEESTVPGEMYQAISRVRRLGQNAEMVRCYYLFASKTIDEVVHKIDQHKANDIKSIVHAALE